MSRKPQHTYDERRIRRLLGKSNDPLSGSAELDRRRRERRDV